MNRIPRWMVVAAAAVVAGVTVGGCAPEAYRRSADAQVQALVRDRERRTLGYEPQVELTTPLPTTRPAKTAYERIPVTPVTPPAESPMEPEDARLIPGPQGPDPEPKAPPLEELQAFVDRLATSRARTELPYGPIPEDRLVRKLDLFGCIEYAIRHSRAYQNEMELLYLEALDVTLERHLLSPRPFARLAANYSGGQKDVDYRSALRVTQSAGVRQRLPYGGEVEASALVELVEALSGNATDGESVEAVLSGSVPLLRRAGLVNLEGLISSERQLVYQVRAFEEFRRSFVVDVASRYFSLLAQKQGLENRRLSVRTFALLTARTQALHAAGRQGRLGQGFLDVQRSLQSQLQAEAQLITAEDAYRTALDDFKLFLGMPVDAAFDVAPVELDVRAPQASADEAVALALRYRLSLRTAEDQWEDAQRAVRNARNSLLPDLDLTARASVGNRDADDWRSLDGRTLTYEAGVSLDFPLDRVAERNAYRRALISLQRAQRNLELARDRAAADVREALRSIRSAELDLEIQRRSIDLARKRLELSNELLKNGLINNRDAVEAQNALLDAQDAYERARASLQIRVLEFLRDTGTLRVDPEAGTLGRVMDRATGATGATAAWAGEAGNASNAAAAGR